MFKGCAPNVILFRGSVERRLRVSEALSEKALTRAYVAFLVTAACVFLVLLVSKGFRLGEPVGLIAITAVALVAERGGVRLTRTIEVSTTSLPFIFAGAIFGPLSAMFVGTIAVLPDLARRDDPQPILRWASWTASRAITAGAAGYAAWAIAGKADRPTFNVILAAVLLASLVESCADLVLGSLTLFVRGRKSVASFASTLMPLFLAWVPLYAPVLAVLIYAYRNISPWSAVLFLVPTFAAQRLFLLYRRQRETAADLAAANSQLERANLSFASALVATLDARDRYTAGHSAVVAVYARDIARRLELSEEDQHLAHLCGLVHDIGKIGLPPGLLEKPGALTLEERRQMEQHSVIGEHILRKVEDYSRVAAIVRHHHERIDGMGYPDGLRGGEIPLLSRIIAVADAYNAMTSDRPYRDAMPSRVARLRLAQAVESQFDTSVVAAFEAILTSATEGYRTGMEIDFALAAREESMDVEKEAPLCEVA
jgi:putative nucleotidyltransferase with HDIG domain